LRPAATKDRFIAGGAGASSQADAVASRKTLLEGAAAPERWSGEPPWVTVGFWSDDAHLDPPRELPAAVQALAEPKSAAAHSDERTDDDEPSRTTPGALPVATLPQDGLVHADWLQSEAAPSPLAPVDSRTRPASEGSAHRELPAPALATSPAPASPVAPGAVAGAAAGDSASEVPAAWPFSTDVEAMSNSSSEADLRGLLDRMAAVSVVLAALFVLGLLAIRRGRASRRTAPADGGELRVVSSLAMPPRSRLYLVQVDRLRVLVGIEAGRLASIVPLPATFDAALLDAEEDRPAAADADRDVTVAERRGSTSGAEPAAFDLPSAATAAGPLPRVAALTDAGGILKSLSGAWPSWSGGAPAVSTAQEAS
jgi:flagellar biogenesis protein FliO